MLPKGTIPSMFRKYTRHKCNKVVVLYFQIIIRIWRRENSVLKFIYSRN